MSESQEDGITILLGLKWHEVGRVSKGKKEIKVEVKAKEAKGCPNCGSSDLSRMAGATGKKCCIPGAMEVV